MSSRIRAGSRFLAPPSNTTTVIPAKAGTHFAACWTVEGEALPEGAELREFAFPLLWPWSHRQRARVNHELQDRFCFTTCGTLAIDPGPLPMHDADEAIEWIGMDAIHANLFLASPAARARSGRCQDASLHRRRNRREASRSVLTLAAPCTTIPQARNGVAFPRSGLVP